MRGFIKILKALSDETRLRILALLMERECCVCEVMQALGISQTRASRNLGILEEAGLVRSRRDGRWIVHFFNEEGLKECEAEFLRALKKVLYEEEVILRDRERLKRARRMGPEGVRGISVEEGEDVL